MGRGTVSAASEHWPSEARRREGKDARSTKRAKADKGEHARGGGCTVATYSSAMESGRTRWIVERRRYFFEKREDGVAERVRAERQDEVAWVRVLEAVYWWPAHEGKQWPAEVVHLPVWKGGDAPEPDAWAHFEAALGIDERYRWEQLPGTSDPG